MKNLKQIKATKRNYAEIGYYGRPITALSKEELLQAFAELVDLYNEHKRKNERLMKMLGDETLKVPRG